jgi:hypothetical protein
MTDQKSRRHVRSERDDAIQNRDPVSLKERRQTRALMPLEILHSALVLLRRGAAIEGAEIAPPTGLRVELARIEPIFPG